MKKFLLTLLAAIMCIGFAACAPTSIDKAKTKMNEAGYTVVGYGDTEKTEGLVGGFVATNGIVNAEKLTAMLFATKEDAAEYYAVLDDAGFVLDGKWVYKGSEEAVKAFKAIF